MTETQQTDMETLLAEIEAEERDDGGPESGGDGRCEVEMECHRALGITNENRKFPYICAWQTCHTIQWCSKRKRLLVVTMKEAA